MRQVVGQPSSWLVWCGVVWCGVVLCGLSWCAAGVVWCAVRCCAGGVVWSEEISKKGWKLVDGWNRIEQGMEFLDG